MKLAVICVIVCAALASSDEAPSAGLYGLQEPPMLVRIDPKTAHPTTVGPRFADEGEGQQLASIDAKNGIYYLIGYNFTSSKPNLIGLTLTAGIPVVNRDLPFAESAFVGVGQAIDVDPATGDVIVTGRMTADGPHAVLRMNPKTGAYKKIAEVPDMDVLGGSSAYDPVTQTEWLQFGYNSSGSISIDLFGVNTKNGQVTHVAQDLYKGRVIDTLEYDPKNKVLIGFGIQVLPDQTLQRQINSYDAVNNRWKNIANITDYLIISGGESALNLKDRTLYGFLQKNDGDPSGPFYLVQVNIDTGKVTAAPEACTDVTECPWSLEYLNL